MDDGRTYDYAFALRRHFDGWHDRRFLRFRARVPGSSADLRHWRSARY
jgi:hypothetical protein